jgi:hypothetical protein
MTKAKKAKAVADARAQRAEARLNTLVKKQQNNNVKKWHRILSLVGFATQRAILEDPSREWLLRSDLSRFLTKASDRALFPGLEQWNVYPPGPLEEFDLSGFDDPLEPYEPREPYERYDIYKRVVPGSPIDPVEAAEYNNWLELEFGKNDDAESIAPDETSDLT